MTSRAVPFHRQQADMQSGTIRMKASTHSSGGTAVDERNHDIPSTPASSPQPTHHRRLVRSSLAAAFLTLLLTLDALVRGRGAFDYRLIRSFQDVDVPYIEPVFSFVSTLTGSFWAITLWTALLLFFAIVRRSWLPALVVLLIPLGGGINWIIGQTVERPRPESAQLNRAVAGIEATAFPSGHVVGAVMFYGVIFMLAGRIRTPFIRLAVRAIAVSVIVLTGPARIWLGAHWVSDTIAAYTLGLSLLLALVWLYRTLDASVGDLPFIHAVPVPHDESIKSGHALTSTILFQGDVVTKIYQPGFLPRAVYWLSFQAEFPYIRNRAALEAAVLRRNLAGKLTEYWYGSNRVARALGIVEIDGRLGLASERIEVTGSQDSDAEIAFLYDLCTRFDAAGLPTWQIDPRQPRGKDNALSGPDGNYYIVDLESGLASPMASPRAWWRAICNADVPLFDTVYFDTTRAYVEQESGTMRSRMGNAWYRELLELIDTAAEANARWHAGEPRIWSRLLRGVQTGFGVSGLSARVHNAARANRTRAESMLAGMVDTWESEQRISADEAEHVRQTLDAPQIHRLIPHFSVHLAIGIAMRFPIGSILRASYTLANLLLASARFLMRRIDRVEWRRLTAIHSPLVVVAAAMPGIGTFSYLLSGPIRSDHLLLRMVADTMLLKVPAKLYDRLGWRALIARPVGGAALIDETGGTISARTTRRTAIGLGILGGALIAAHLLLLVLNRAIAPDTGWWTRLLELFAVDAAGSIPTGYALALATVTVILALATGLVIWLRQGFNLLPWGMLGLLALAIAVEEHLPTAPSALQFVSEFGAGTASWTDWAQLIAIFAAAGIGVVVSIRFVLDLPARFRGMVALGVTIFLGGALGLEIVGSVYRWIFDATDFKYQLITTAEELAELIGIAVLFYVALELARLQIGSRSAAVEQEATS